jgi:hypothetical protein
MLLLVDFINRRLQAYSEKTGRLSCFWENFKAFFDISLICRKFIVTKI